jgi:hypothetical protein
MATLGARGRKLLIQIDGAAAQMGRFHQRAVELVQLLVNELAEVAVQPQLRQVEP